MNFWLFSLYFTHCFAHYLTINLADKMYLLLYWVIYSRRKMLEEHATYVFQARLKEFLDCYITCILQSLSFSPMSWSFSRWVKVYFESFVLLWNILCPVEHSDVTKRPGKCNTCVTIETAWHCPRPFHKHPYLLSPMAIAGFPFSPPEATANFCKSWRTFECHTKAGGSAILFRN